ncbi:1-(5-phosphoribosyl)-5-[(5-phosphoribosylamino)methylideneamino]imidazole-4-carboxamide isomerase [Candidatus Micrarchaeota archaeon]|nr:1-(5-phosphoribosyl)-5-[(5-phosphoribosylamino)methylideneamino]imidazole-4-carboxamide isomerase [Candidatus Micrarchaeota archaeon]
MQVIPAIDLMGGKVVRLRQGNRQSATVYSREPYSVAENFVEQGAGWLHVVDLDAAFGTGNNLDAIREIASLKASVQVGGGMRNVGQTREMLCAGAKRIIIGSAATANGKLEKLASDLGERMWVAADVRDGKISINGWKNDSGIPADAFLNRALKAGAGGAVVTDISRDGMVKGISKSFFASVKSKFPNLKLIASGGVSSLDDIKALGQIGYDGAIVGKAIYEGKIDLKNAVGVGGNAC